jgi:nitrilase
MNIGYAKGGSSIIAPLGIPLVEPVEGPAIVRAELQAWMIKAWKAIIDTNGHYARPDLLKLTVANHVPSQHPVTLRTQPRPALLAEAAERNDVEPALVESMMHDVARLNVVGGREGSSA